MKNNQSVINWSVYEDSVEYLGVAKATMPDINYMTQTISGAGIAGNIDAAIIGHIDAMTLSLDWRMMTPDAMNLSSPKRHTIVLRAAQQYEDTTENTVGIDAMKHTMVIVPKTFKAGTLEPAAPNNGSAEFSVRYWKATFNGNVFLEIDPVNYKFVVNGVDYLKDARTALGKNN